MGPARVAAHLLTRLDRHRNSAEHINRVHNDRIAGQGLTFSYDQRMESGDALLLRWSMTAPSGDVVGRGVDTVFRDVDGKVTRAYMFMGVN